MLDRCLRKRRVSAEPLGWVCKQTFPGIKCINNLKQMGRLTRPPPINKKTSRWSGLIPNITLIFNGRWCKTGPAWVKNGAVKTTLTFQSEGKRWQIAFPPGRPLLMAPFATPPPIKPRSVLSLRAAGTPADGVRLSEPAGA